MYRIPPCSHRASRRHTLARSHYWHIFPLSRQTTSDTSQRCYIAQLTTRAAVTSRSRCTTARSWRTILSCLTRNSYVSNFHVEASSVAHLYEGGRRPRSQKPPSSFSFWTPDCFQSALYLLSLLGVPSRVRESKQNVCLLTWISIKEIQNLILRWLCCHRPFATPSVFAINSDHTTVKTKVSKTQGPGPSAGLITQD